MSDPEDALAAAARAASAPERVRFERVTTKVGSRRSFGLPVDENFFREEGYRGAAEYWAAAMSEPMKASSFAHLLSVHLMGPIERAGEFDRRTKVHQNLDSALRLAAEAGEPWFIKDAVTGAGDLDRAMVRPRAAAEWLLSLPMRRDLVPPGLRAFVEAGAKPAAIESTKSSAPGRPTSMDLVAAEMRARAARDELLKTLTAEAEYLARWFAEAHPSAARPTPKTIMNRLRRDYKLLQASRTKL